MDTLTWVPPVSPPTAEQARRGRVALYVAMLMLGALLASWVTRTPTIRAGLHISTSELGLVLFGMSIGSMIGILSSGRVVKRWGGRRVLAIGTSCAAMGAVVIGLSTSAATPFGAFAGMAAFGLGIGVGEVALNIEAAAIEHSAGRIVLPMVHGFFSLGTVAGATIGIAANAWHTPVFVHLTIVSLAAAVALGSTLRWIPPGTGRANTTQRGKPRRPRVRAVWRDRTVICIGVIAMATALAEGAANDWLPLIFVDGYGAPAVIGSVLFTAFAAAMAIGRFAGNRALAYLSRTAMIRLSVMAAILGIGLVVWAPNLYCGAAAVLLWGLGASLGFPLAISAAADHPTNAVARVSAVSVVAYAAFLVGPPVLGTAGGHLGLRHAMIGVLVVLTVALVSSGGMARVGSRRSDSARPERQPDADFAAGNRVDIVTIPGIDG